MKNKIKISSLFFLIVLYSACLFLCSCSGIKSVPDGEFLFTGSRIKVISDSKIKNKSEIISQSKSVLAPRINKSYFGLRPKLWIYYIAGQPSRNKGFKHWLKYKVGEAPVLLSSVNPGLVSKVIDAKLFNMGIFNGNTTFKEEKHKTKAMVIYELKVHVPFKINSISFVASRSPVDSLIQSTLSNTLIKPGHDYNLTILKKERERIDDILKNNGYYYFKPEYLIFQADSSHTNKTISLKLSIKPEAPLKTLIPYHFKDIYIETDYTLSPSDSIQKDTILDFQAYFIEAQSVIHHQVISRSVFIKPKELYSKNNHNLTLSRLMSMGNFKFVNIRFEESDTNNTGYLDAHIYITPTPKRTIRFELDAISKSNSFVGPALNINYKNRNSLNGAELLVLNLRGSFETQFSGAFKGLYSFEIGPQIEFYVPRFILPFKIREPKTYYIPKTRFSLSYDYLRRVQYYNLTSLQFIFGYKWKDNIKTDHELNPVNINYIAVTQKSDAFQNLLDDNFLLKKSFEEQFIAGLNYVFIYNEQAIPAKRHPIFINFTADIAGNSITLAKNIFTRRKPEVNNPHELAGKAYSQFAKGTCDVRNYLTISAKSKLVFRIYGGVGVAYGNSTVLPYIKQFFSGGPNSIRAFRINALGPGNYIAPDSLYNFIEQGGDIKLEGNVEYRFPIISFLKGAFFADAGNIWLLKPNAEIQARAITFNTFYKEIGIGTGFGLRFDVTFFVLRLDLAFPIRKPWLPENDRWVLKQINFGNPAWRSDNLVLNIAIGYPF